MYSATRDILAVRVVIIVPHYSHIDTGHWQSQIGGKKRIIDTGFNSGVDGGAGLSKSHERFKMTARRSLGESLFQRVLKVRTSDYISVFNCVDRPSKTSLLINNLRYSFSLIL